jgi:hypothetical protein
VEIRADWSVTAKGPVCNNVTDRVASVGYTPYTSIRTVCCLVSPERHKNILKFSH